MSEPKYRKVPKYAHHDRHDPEDPHFAICLELSNGHVHYVRNTSTNEILDLIEKGEAHHFDRHFQNEEDPIKNIGINCSQIVTFYGVFTENDSEKVRSGVASF